MPSRFGPLGVVEGDGHAPSLLSASSSVVLPNGKVLATLSLFQCFNDEGPIASRVTQAEMLTAHAKSAMTVFDALGFVTSYSHSIVPGGLLVIS